VELDDCGGAFGVGEVGFLGGDYKNASLGDFCANSSI